MGEEASSFKLLFECFSLQKCKSLVASSTSLRWSMSFLRMVWWLGRAAATFILSAYLVPRYYLPYSGPWPQCTPHWGLFWDCQFLRAKQANNWILAWFFSDDTFEGCRSCQNSIGISPTYLPSTRNLLNYISVVWELTLKIILRYVQ